MKRFVIKTVVSLFIFFVIAETIARIVIDPFYFYSIDSYNIKLNEPSLKEVFDSKKTSHVDYLFIGTSRVPATINPSIIMGLDQNKVAVVAGRGYMTPGVHYQALKYKLQCYPDYLRGAKVFIEYPGPDVYTDPYNEDKMKVYEPILDSDEAMPHLLLPYLDFRNLLTFLKESRNSLSVKLDLVAEFFLSSYRTSSYIKEKVSYLGSHLLIKETEKQLVSEGGIRNDNLDNAKQLAIDYALKQIEEIDNNPLLTFKDMNNSTLSHFNDLIREHGGTLYLYKMPLNSIHEDVYNSRKSLANKEIFEGWIASKGIKVINNETFRFGDSDFPDIWHLSAARRDEFTLRLYEEIKKL